MIPDLPAAVAEAVARYGGQILCDVALFPRGAELWLTMLPGDDADRVASGVFYAALDDAEGWDFPTMQSVRPYAVAEPAALRAWVARQRTLYPAVRIVG